MIYSAERLARWSEQKQVESGVWAMARPENYKHESIWSRLRQAWQLLRGEIDGLKWHRQ